MTRYSEVRGSERTGDLLRFNLAVDQFELGAPITAALRDPKAFDPNSGGKQVFAPILWDRRALTGL